VHELYVYQINKTLTEIVAFVAAVCAYAKFPGIRNSLLLKEAEMTGIGQASAVRVLKIRKAPTAQRSAQTGAITFLYQIFCGTPNLRYIGQKMR
jgi:hypothetical protein